MVAEALEVGAFDEDPYPDDRILAYTLGCLCVCLLKLEFSIMPLFSGINDLSLGRLVLLVVLSLLGKPTAYFLGCLRVCFLKLEFSVLSGIEDLSLGRLVLLVVLSLFGKPTLFFPPFLWKVLFLAFDSWTNSFLLFF